MLVKCYVRFYSRPDVERLAASVNPKTTAILDTDREYNASSSTSSNATLPISLAPNR